MRIVVAATAAILMTATTSAVAVPLTLNGMGMQKQWVDTEAKRDEMPAFVWGNSDTAKADRIGLYVRFANGVEGSISYSGVSTRWNSFSSNAFGTLISADGFFASYTNAGLHYLFNSTSSLPIAWINNPRTQFGSNVELDYSDTAVNSEFRISTAGWGAADIATYSSSAPLPVPEPASLALLGLGLAGIAAGRKKRK